MKKRYKRYDLPFNPNKYLINGKYKHVNKKIQQIVRRGLYRNIFQRRKLQKIVELKNKEVLEQNIYDLLHDNTPYYLVNDKGVPIALPITQIKDNKNTEIIMANGWKK